MAPRRTSLSDHDGIEGDPRVQRARGGALRGRVGLRCHRRGTCHPRADCLAGPNNNSGRDVRDGRRDGDGDGQRFSTDDDRSAPA